jgi:hypothetical protein
MSPFSAFILSILCILIVAVPRRWAALPILLCMLYITQRPMIMIAGLHLSCYRILITFGMIRVFIKKEYFPHDTNKIARYIILWAIVGLTAYTLLHGFNRELVFKISLIYDVLMLFFYFKSIFKSLDDIIFICKMLPFIILPLTCFMIRESLTGNNIYSYFGDVPVISDIRNGRFRCQGPFAHPILAGTFGATVYPFIAALWFQKGYKKIWVIIGMLCSAIIALTAGSSGAFMTLLLENLAFGFWFLRNQMQWVRRGIVMAIIGLIFFMKAPIWYLFAKLSDATGGSGWHRAFLLDQAFGKYFHEWWLIGTKVTRHWMPTGVFYTQTQSDITNQFLWEGVNGGIFTMGLFIAFIVCCFKAVGHSLKKNELSPFNQRFFLWALGVALFGHIVSFMSVTYFDQIIIFWTMLLGMIAAISAIPLYSVAPTLPENTFER